MEEEEEMKGSIVEIEGSNGKAWRIFVSAGKNGAGKRIRITRRVSGKKSDARRELRQIIDQVEAKSYVFPTRTILREFLEERWLPVVKSRVRETTFETTAYYAASRRRPPQGRLGAPGPRIGSIHPRCLLPRYARHPGGCDRGT